MNKPVKVLFATRTSPFPGDSGSGAYVFDLLRHLSRRGLRVHVVWTEPPDLVPSRGWYHPPTGSRGIFSLEIMDTLRLGSRFWRPSVVWLPFKARLSYRVKSALRVLGLWREKRICEASTGNAAVPASPNWGERCTPGEFAAIQRAAARFGPDVVLANYAWMAPAAASLGKPCAVLAHDVRHRQLHLVDGRPVEILNEHMDLETERNCLEGCSAVIAIQQVEAGVFGRFLPNRTVVTAPMAVTPAPLPFPPGENLLFVGSQHRANLEGLTWFFEHVWPRVRKECLTARLLVAGSVSEKLASPLPEGVEVLGRLPDLAAAYARAGIVVAPILKGSGIKIKILEAIGHGRACVTTSVGAEGLEALRPSLRVADTAENFADDIVRLLKSPAAASAAAAEMAALARIHLSDTACYDPVESLLRQLAGKSP